MAEPRVTIVVTQRERFSYTEPSLESIYQNTEQPFRLVYVDAGSPRHVRRYLEAAARKRGFEYLRIDGYRSPNEARNLGLRFVKSEYVVFVDNDLLVSPGWLDTLVACADETAAWIVGPLYLAGAPGSEVIHMAGGLAHFREEHGQRVFYEEHRFGGMKVSEVPTPLSRGPCELVEFHCMLVRTEVFERLGPLDEGLLSAQEHIDLCLAAREADGPVYFEPAAVVTYVTPPPFDWSDYPYFVLRWSGEWNAASVSHFRRKWRLGTDDSGLRDLEQWLRGHRNIYFEPVWKTIHAAAGWRCATAVERAASACVLRFFARPKRSGMTL